MGLLAHFYSRTFKNYAKKIKGTIKWLHIDTWHLFIHTFLISYPFSVEDFCRCVSFPNKATCTQLCEFLLMLGK